MESAQLLKAKEVLLLEDDLILGKRIEAYLTTLGMEVSRVTSCADAEKMLGTIPFDYALFDLNLPDGQSLDLLRNGKVHDNTQCVLMTGEGGIQSAIESIRLGAADYISKPFDLEELPLVFHQARSRLKSQRVVEHFKSESKGKSEQLFFEGEFSKDLLQLQKILSADKRLQKNLPPLLVDGATGSGKSTYARWIHANGPRAEAPFIALNCSAIAENLIESEMFGHEKGAFTDAKGSRMGLFEAADQGTLFLDEVASLSLAAQAKLLLAIENGTIRRVGGNKDIGIDVRFIAAANRDLREMVQEGSFREDLFHRLDLLRISIPPLASRSKDLPKLADHFLNLLAQKYRMEKPSLDPISIQYLQGHSWPGNNRELLHELERALVLHEPGTPLQFTSLGQAQFPDRSSDWLNESFQFPKEGFDLEKEILRLIHLAIEQTGGNVSEASRLLGVPRDYLRYRLKK
jgi:two-component system response regulator AtoC